MHVPIKIKLKMLLIKYYLILNVRLIKNLNQINI